jgi:hypothetical protein
MLWSRRRPPIIAPSFKSSRQSAVGSRQDCSFSSAPKGHGKVAGGKRSAAPGRNGLKRAPAGAKDRRHFAATSFCRPSGAWNIVCQPGASAKRAAPGYLLPLRGLSSTQILGSVLKPILRRVRPQGSGYKRQNASDQRSTTDYPLPTTHFFLDFPGHNNIHSTVCLHRGILNGSN